MKRLSLVPLALVAFAATAGAQSWRTLDVSRQLRDTTLHRVHVQYGAGKLDVRPTDQPVLYAMELRYDEELTDPIHEYDAESRRLRVGIQRQSVRFRNVSRQNDGAMRLILSKSVPMALELSFGAAESRIDLGGLTLRDLKIETGASETRLNFSTPNNGPMRRFELDFGAAGGSVRNIANAGAERIEVDGGVGSFDLDFGGQWTRNAELDLSVALGSAKIVVPPDVGLRIDSDRFLASVRADDMIRRDGTMYSENWETARYRLRVKINAAFGSVEVVRR